MLYPLKFQPIYKEKIWGGSNLKKYLDKDIPEGQTTGESWELADHFENTSIVINGELKGKKLNQILREYKQNILGTGPDKKFLNKFPLLIKFIDANDKLSVQVHPDDEYAKQNEKGEYGKNEMWYIVHAKEEAELIAGLVPGTTKDIFRNKLDNGQLEDILHRIKVKTGDVLFIPAGRLHAIMPGLVINEIQQNSDVTYRVYDWGRKGVDGQPRDLHIEKSMDTINFNDYNPSIIKPQYSQFNSNKYAILVQCDYFQVEKYILNKKIEFNLNKNSFQILTLIEGKGIISWQKKELEIKKGETILIPACIVSYVIIPDTELTIIRSYI